MSSETTGAPIRLLARPLTAAAFAPFGAVTDAVAPDDRVAVAGATNLRAGVAPRLGWFHAAASRLPFTATVMERHRYSSQSFVPGAAAAWLVLVAPDDHGAPALHRALAFLATGEQAVTYAPDTWHHPLVALDRTERFAVLTFLDGGPDDEQFVTLPHPLVIAAA